MSNVETVRQMYEAFGRGDIPSMLEGMSNRIEWEHHPTGNAAQERDVPYMRRRSGREEAAGFFEDIQADFEMHSFEPHSFLQGDGLVASVVSYELTVKSTGKRVRDEEIHLWRFDSDGKVAAFRHFLDTAKAIEAHS